MARNPNETVVEKEYVFEVHGEITVPAYSEEDADERMGSEMTELIKDAIPNGELEIEGVT